MQHWKLSESTYFPAERESVWRNVMSQICLPEGIPIGRDKLYGDVINVISPAGICFSRVQSTAQILSGACTTSQDSIWLAILLDGESMLLNTHAATGDAPPALQQVVNASDILYGPTGVDSTLRLSSDFSLLYVKIPKHALPARLVNPTMLGVGALATTTGPGRMLASLLRSVAEELDTIDDSTLRPVETALTEFVVACLGEKAGICSFGNPSRSAHFHQICQSLESQLSDPGLNLHSIAQQQRVSARYIQKLFEEGGLSFGMYVRERRLENCRRELSNPLFRKLSISEICFRWGFNDAAHFSRTFHQRFGATPRLFRQMTCTAQGAENSLCTLQ